MTYQLGIDLGTTFTSAAVARDGRVEVTALVGPPSAPMRSVLYLGVDGQVLIGEAAWRRRLTEPDRVAREVKRRVGDPGPLLLGGVPYAAEQLVAKLLGGVVDAVAATEGESAERIVMTYPASWGPYRLDLLGLAIRHAGVEATTITEPEAVATYYASNHGVEPGQILAVYSLGSARFEATVLRKTQTGFEMLGQPEGIERVGDIDAAVFDYVVRQLGGLFDLDTTDARTATALARLRDDCITAKEALSYEIEMSIPVFLPSVQTEVRVSRADFEAMVRPLLEETTGALGRVLRSAMLAPTDLSAVLVVGGSTRIPLVRELLRGALGRSVTILEPAENAVALGAALVAAEGRRFNIGAQGSLTTKVGSDPTYLRPHLPLDDDVQFTVYRPSQVQPDRWYQLLAFAHKVTLIEDLDGGVVDPVEAVERQAQALLDDERISFDSIRADASSGLLRGSELRFEPWLEQGEVNPASATVHWLEPVHRAEFRIRLPASADGRTIRGAVRVFVGVMIVGEVPFRLQVSSMAPATLRPEARTAARPYRQIFASYSRLDAAVVEAVARYVSVTGDRYLIDVQDLRSGERWERKLEELIERADVFQLFWSPNSMRSPFVRQEWEYALALERDEFVRPVYWGDKLPEDKAVGLPPEALRALHFSKLAVDVPSPPAPSQAPNLSYLDEVADYLGRDGLSFSDQQQLLGTLKQLVKEEDKRAAAVALLRGLRRRNDLYARVADEIDIELSRCESPPAPRRAAPQPASPAPASSLPSPGRAAPQPESPPPGSAPSSSRAAILITVVVVLVVIALLVLFL